jgi:hypothetical protein
MVVVVGAIFELEELLDILVSPIWIREDPSCSSCDGNVNKALVQIGQVMYLKLNCCSHEEWEINKGCHG